MRGRGEGGGPAFFCIWPATLKERDGQRLPERERGGIDDFEESKRKRREWILGLVFLLL